MRGIIGNEDSQRKHREKMPNRSRQKGDRMERAVVNAFLDMGIEAQRIPLSGAMGGEFSGDVIIGSEKFRGECKSRASGFAQIYKWLDNCALLFVKRDRSETIVCLRMADFLEIYRKAEKCNG